MVQNSAGAMKLGRKFSRTSDVKIKERAFVGPKIRELIQDVKFEDQLSDVEKAAWKSLKNISTNCLGNHKAKTIGTRWPILYNPKSYGV
jgi:phosphoenolpyruvate synthase/pyruvate phosphate dikinase